MDFKDVLEKQGYDLSRIMVMRHQPDSLPLRRILRWCAQEQPKVYNAYQRIQGEAAEKALQKAEVVASFIADNEHALFIGLYRRGTWRTITEDQLWNIPEIAQFKPYGMKGIKPKRDKALWFDLTPLTDLADFKGRLLVKWPAGRLWWRWAKSNEFPVCAIHQESILDAEMPGWDNLILSWEEIKMMPSKWKARLASWRGVYYIFDSSNNMGYVGSASGADNILGRWLNYAQSGHGGNKQLKQRAPKNFLFSILQRVSPDMGKDEIIQLESTWKVRLHTRKFGLNDN